ncbi:MAG: family 78 glycoside hydrolase catalytic domain [Bacteroidota bacterium]
MLKQGQILYLICLVSISCNPTIEDNSVRFFHSRQAVWITCEEELPTSDSLFYQDNPAPLFRKEFQILKPISQAKLYITSAGYYRAYLNGENVGKNILDPAWTDYSKRIYYAEYEIKSLLSAHDNCIGVSLGNGFYNPLPLRKWGRRNLRNDLAEVGKPAFTAKIIVDYKDGTSQIITTDSTWRYHDGPIRSNSVYLGVRYDARDELNDWNTQDFNDENWKNAVISKGPGGELMPSFFPPVQITQEIKPTAIYSSEPGTWIVDMGVNFTGTYRIKLSGNEGDTVYFRFGERVYNDGSLNPMTSVIGQIKRPGVGGPGAPDVAWQTDRYIFGKTSPAIFQPDFTYHVFRYMEIKGLDYKPDQADITGLFMHTNVVAENNFSSSSGLLNSIQDATRRTFLANLVSVQSDCPAREKFGYGGDLNATSESYIYNFDMKDFYRKTVYDWIDAMNDTTFVDTAPFVGVKYCGISWESAFLTTQYYLYLYYNDLEFVKELYELDNKWMDKVARIHPGGIVTEGLSDHESLLPVPVELTGTCHYIQCARIMSTFATVMGDPERAKDYQRLADKLTDMVRERFWNQPVNEKINRQTLFATLLYHQIVPEEEIEAAKDSLLNAVQHGPAGHFNTGIFGTKYVLETLSKYVSPDSVFKIVNSTEFPGWGFMIDNGATTLWETWKESDNVYSNCHPMFGSVTEWYYRWLAGIRPIEDSPGFSEFLLNPTTPLGLESVNCTYHSPKGAIVSNWKRTNPGEYQYVFIIPEGAKAHVRIPVGKAQKIQFDNKNLELMNRNIREGQFELGSGSYTLTVSK